MRKAARPRIEPRNSRIKGHSQSRRTPIRRQVGTPASTAPCRKFGGKEIRWQATLSPILALILNELFGSWSKPISIPRPSMPKETPFVGSVPLIAERSTSTRGVRTTSPLLEACRSLRSRSGRRYSKRAHGDQGAPAKGATAKPSSNSRSAELGICTATASSSQPSATPITNHKKKSTIQTKSINPNPCNRLEADNTRIHPSSATASERIHKPRRYHQTDVQIGSSRIRKSKAKQNAPPARRCCRQKPAGRHKPAGCVNARRRTPKPNSLAPASPRSARPFAGATPARPRRESPDPQPSARAPLSSFHPKTNPSPKRMTPLAEKHFPCTQPHSAKSGIPRIPPSVQSLRSAIPGHPAHRPEPATRGQLP